MQSRNHGARLPAILFVCSAEVQEERAEYAAQDEHSDADRKHVNRFDF